MCRLLRFAGGGRSGFLGLGALGLTLRTAGLGTGELRHHLCVVSRLLCRGAFNAALAEGLDLLAPHKGGLLGGGRLQGGGSTHRRGWQGGGKSSPA